MRKLAIQALPASLADARRLASRLSLPVDEIALHRFPDGELRVTVAPAACTTIIYASLDQPNDKLIGLLFAAEALRRDGATRLVLLAPYLCYMRQDAAFHPGEAISQRAVGRLLAANVDRVITVDAHLHRTVDIRAVFAGIEADNLSAMPAIGATLLKQGIDPATVIVGPDAESRRWVSDLADRLGLAFTVAQKSRRGDRSVEVALTEPASVSGRPVLLADDIVSSGGTLISAAKALRAAGATAIDAVITHALFPPDMIAAFVEAGVRSVRSTCSVPHPTNAIPLDDVLAGALVREFSDSRSPEAIP
ncbi:MAG TPA: ribose-phosphate diphosphokinase [Bradyrhizobium sp.]|nr:ribose-phosphate diphosphokinase [Bradyrhizobium sp.]